MSLLVLCFARRLVVRGLEQPGLLFVCLLLFLRRHGRLIVIVWWPLQHISGGSFKTVRDREKVFCGNTRVIQGL